MRIYKPPPYTLHDAMREILKKCPNQTAEHTYLAAEVNRQKLYWQTDGSPVKSSQIGARAKNYPDMFEKIQANPVTGTKAKIRLK